MLAKDLSKMNLSKKIVVSDLPATENEPTTVSSKFVSPGLFSPI
jgi:hypothetical protein